MSIFKSGNKNKTRVQEIMQALPSYPLDSVARTNLLLEAQILMSMEINKHAGWLDFNSSASILAGK